MSWLISTLNLALRFNLHMLQKPFAAAEDSKDRFLENYRADRLFPLSPELRRLLPTFQRCIACGLCDTICPNLAPARRHLYNGPSDLATSCSRELPGYHLLAPYLKDWKACGECRECESICPTGVPLLEMARVVEELTVMLRSRGKKQTAFDQ